jgi:hypothetical protein
MINSAAIGNTVTNIEELRVAELIIKGIYYDSEN